MSNFQTTYIFLGLYYKYLNVDYLSDYLNTLHHAEHKVLLVHVAGLPSNFDEASEFLKPKNDVRV